MKTGSDDNDPKALIWEAFQIEGITMGECRTIFLDWALSLPATQDTQSAITALLARHAGAPQDHPMTITLREGLASQGKTGRRGGRAARVSG